MNNENTIPCLYCQAENDSQQQTCYHCGMPLAPKHPENKKMRGTFFIKVFVLIAVFCLIMMAYLPR